MTTSYVRAGRVPFLAACCVLVSVGAGCGGRTLTWNYLEGTPDRLANAKRVALVCEVSLAGQMPMLGGTSKEELANAIVSELMHRSYQVTVVRENMMAGLAPSTNASDRSKAVERTGADLLFEFSTQGVQRMVMHMAIFRLPFTPHKTTTEWKTEIRQMTLRISSPKDRSVLGTTTVRFDDPKDKLNEAVKDLCVGLDMIRQGRPAGTTELKGPPGQDHD
jgi:hypothetical protein